MPATETQTNSALLGVYKPSGPTFVGGEGCELIAEDGRRFLDFTSGIAVNALGYGDPDVAAAIRGALDGGLIHTSNLFRTQPAAELAGWLAEHSFADRVFFCNSGAEANEGAIKFARRFAGEGKAEIIAFRGGFHGRTMGALAATDRAAYQDPFRPLMPGVVFCDVGDTAEVDRLLARGKTAAVLIEPIQAEGGVKPVPSGFLKSLRYLCDEAGVLLMMDEVQTGLGRTGHLWAHQASGDHAGRDDAGQAPGGRPSDGRRADDGGRGRRAQAGRPRVYLRRRGAGGVGRAGGVPQDRRGRVPGRGAAQGRAAGRPAGRHGAAAARGSAPSAARD